MASIIQTNGWVYVRSVQALMNIFKNSRGNENNGPSFFMTREGVLEFGARVGTPNLGTVS